MFNLTIALITNTILIHVNEYNYLICDINIVTAVQLNNVKNKCLLIEDKRQIRTSYQDNYQIKYLHEMNIKCCIVYFSKSNKHILSGTYHPFAFTFSIVLPKTYSLEAIDILKKYTSNRKINDISNCLLN